MIPTQAQLMATETVDRAAWAFLTLLFTMVTCMILGMGLPSIPSYLITATIAAPGH